jgi:hypothetical protein
MQISYTHGWNPKSAIADPMPINIFLLLQFIPFDVHEKTAVSKKRLKLTKFVHGACYASGV